MNYLIYHNSEFIEYGFRSKVQEHLGFPVIIKHENLKLVGRIRADSLDEAYRITNHIDCSWWRNPEVVWWRPARSTSVGDVIAELHDDGQCYYYTVESFGFNSVNPIWINAHRLEQDLPNDPQKHDRHNSDNRSLVSRISKLVFG
jgi:hypothetical protein